MGRLVEGAILILSRAARALDLVSRGSCEWLLKSASAPAPPRAEDPYPTHLPVLIGLARLIRPHRVLELGAGIHSTAAFLDRSAFPELEFLLSLETDVQWHEKIRGAIRDERFEMKCQERPMWQLLEQVDLEEYDLIFVDDSATAAERVRTLRELVRRRPRRAAVVVHDFDVPDYRRAVRWGGHTYCFDAWNPMTGVVWRDAPIERAELARLNVRLKQHASWAPAGERGRWVDLLQRA